MLVEMPYGTINIVDANDAIKFVRNHCSCCPYSNQMYACSGEQAAKCSDNVIHVILAFTPNQRLDAKYIIRGKHDA